MVIYCCECKSDVKARLTDGVEIYRHRPDLHHMPFWKCDACKNYVACHYKTAQRTAPLGCIPNRDIKIARMHIHAILDPLWAGNRKQRGRLYAKISEQLGYQYHTAEIKCLEEARKVYLIVKKLAEN
jgi:hypothetical protein